MDPQLSLVSIADLPEQMTKKPPCGVVFLWLAAGDEDRLDGGSGAGAGGSVISVGRSADGSGRSADG